MPLKMSIDLWDKATWRPVKNFFEGPSEIRGVCLHVQEGYGSIWELSNTDRGPDSVSSHLWVAQEKDLEQYVKFSNIAWAEVAGNPYYISIETEGVVEEPLTPFQFDTVSELLELVHNEYNVPIQAVDHYGHGLTTHCFYPSGQADPSWGNHSCPGLIRLGQVPAIITTTKNRISPPPVVKGKPMFVAVATDTFSGNVKWSKDPQTVNKGDTWLCWDNAVRTYFATGAEVTSGTTALGLVTLAWTGRTIAGIPQAGV
jgi:hypothetical protein